MLCDVSRVSFYFCLLYAHRACNAFAALLQLRLVLNFFVPYGSPKALFHLPEHAWTSGLPDRFWCFSGESDAWILLFCSHWPKPPPRRNSAASVTLSLVCSRTIAVSDDMGKVGRRSCECKCSFITENAVLLCVLCNRVVVVGDRQFFMLGL